jgi:acyl-CoA reductase-like NAD-dependent aldehyde dehydrogenase/nicotinamidase-related amidase
MKPAIVLIDFQNDFLNASGLEPAAGQVVRSAAALLDAGRKSGLPIFHVWTTVQREPDNRMPHWKASGTWRCVEGADGHQTPPALRPLAGETIVHKQFFSGFYDGKLDAALRAAGCDTLILAGVHLHGCVRATAMDAYERGYKVWLAADAVASDDPLHAAITRQYLQRRAARFIPTSDLLSNLQSPSSGDLFTHRSPRDSSVILWDVPVQRQAATTHATASAQRALPSWRALAPRQRAKALDDWAAQLIAESESLAGQIVEDIGKPITMARGEIRRSAEILRALAQSAPQPLEAVSGPNARYRHEPLGVVAIITPYNNPVAIPVGKIGPALLYGNAVVWKPAPAASMIARRLVELGRSTGWPDGILNLCIGDHLTASLLAEDEHVDGLSISGAAAAGYSLQAICAKRHIPFQSELGGNNPAIVWDDADLPKAAELIAAGAFGFAGQRCTANRRAIVSSDCFDSFVDFLTRATARLAWGDPRNEETVIGPLISAAKHDEIRALLDRAAAGGNRLLMPHENQPPKNGAYCPPTIVLADNPADEIVQEESFGPVLVVQRASDFDHAMSLCNGVKQGLVAALFSESSARRAQFLRDARAGVLKINRATADADATSPLGGWKASGSGPAEHGPSDREFYCRVQTIYEG